MGVLVAAIIILIGILVEKVGKVVNEGNVLGLSLLQAGQAGAAVLFIHGGEGGRDWVGE